MEINPNFVLEDCPICRGNGFVVHEGGWNVQVECCDCSAHTVYVEYEIEEEKKDAPITPEGWGANLDFGGFGDFGSILDSKDFKFGD